MRSPPVRDQHIEIHVNNSIPGLIRAWKSTYYSPRRKPSTSTAAHRSHGTADTGLEVSLGAEDSSASGPALITPCVSTSMTTRAPGSDELIEACLIFGSATDYCAAQQAQQVRRIEENACDPGRCRRARAGPPAQDSAKS